MAPAEAAFSTIISSLLSAFDSSRQLLHRIKNNVQPSKSRLSRKNVPAQDPTGDEEAQARNEQMQLKNAQQRIAQAYERNSGQYGARYRHGDGMKSLYSAFWFECNYLTTYNHRPRQNIPEPHPPGPKYGLDEYHLQPTSARNE